MSIEVMRQALEALEMLARYENPETKIQVRKPKDGGPIVTMYPHKVASDAATVLRAAIEQPRQWVEITDNEARALVNRATFGDRTNWQAFVYMVDAKLKEKNHAD